MPLSRVSPVSRSLFALTLCSLAAAAVAQPKQVVKPPESQAWIDVATFGGMGLPMGMGGMGGAGGGGGAAGAKAMLCNPLGQTQAMSPGRWVDVTLYTKHNPQLEAAVQNVPAGFLSPALQLQSPPPARAKPAPDPNDERPIEVEQERPKAGPCGRARTTRAWCRPTPAWWVNTASAAMACPKDSAFSWGRRRT